MLKKIKRNLTLNPTKTISLSFLMVILIGSVLLSLPIANQQETIPFINHLFIATSATCVTGLSPIVVGEQYSLFGQLVILVMIQIGGLGFITLLMIFFLFLKRKLSFSSRLLMAEAINENNLDRINKFIRYIISYTCIVELAGAVCLLPVFLRDYPLIQSIYYSIFHSISAFCNAGFDVLGGNSLMNYQQNTWCLFVISSLIILGGIGFLVVKEIHGFILRYKEEHFSLRRFWQRLSLHAKLAVMMTLILIGSGTIFVFLLERSNPDTIGQLPIFHQIANSYFQSVTYRTAGFATFDQSCLTEPSKLIGCIYMFIGGSPGGTAGGIKTITLAILFLTVRSSLKGNKEIVAFSRSIDMGSVIRAISIIVISLVIVVSSSVLLSIVEPFNMIDILYEVFSAYATVGLSCNVTGFLSDAGKIIIMVLMYSGRIGPVALMLTLMKKGRLNSENDIKYPKGDLLVG